MVSLRALSFPTPVGVTFTFITLFEGWSLSGGHFFIENQQKKQNKFCYL